MVRIGGRFAQILAPLVVKHFSVHLSNSPQIDSVTIKTTKYLFMRNGIKYGIDSSDFYATQTPCLFCTATRVGSSHEETSKLVHSNEVAV